MNQLPTILKKARQALDLTQEDVAKRLGISQRAYAFYEDENNDRIPKPKRLAELGKVLNIPIKTLMAHYASDSEENATDKEVNDNGSPLPGPDSSQKVLLDLSIILDLLKSAQGEKSRLMDVIDANLTSLQTTQQIILAHVKAGHKWEAKKYGEGSEEKENSILAQLGKFADEYLPGDEEVYRNVKNDK